MESKIDQLFEVSVPSRDENWEKSLLQELPNVRVKLLATEPREGPDSWPYMMVATGPEADEPIAKMLAWLSTRGIGLAINPQKTAPDFVLTYGMVWNFRERGEFLSPVAKGPTAGEIKIENGQQVLTGPPSEGYLPKYVREILKRFLLDQGVLAPKVLMVSFDGTNYDLCFSIESLGSPKQSEQAGIAEAIAWFLPAHYSVSLVSEKAIPGFQPL